MTPLLCLHRRANEIISSRVNIAHPGPMMGEFLENYEGRPKCLRINSLCADARPADGNRMDGQAWIRSYVHNLSGSAKEMEWHGVVVQMHENLFDSLDFYVDCF